MASSGSGYDLGATTFSPDGRIFQIEYAQKACDTSGTSLGLHCSDGIVVCVEKVQQSKMLVEGQGRRVHATGKGSGVALTGFLSDGRQVVERARSEAASYIDTYGMELPPHLLADRVGQYIHYFTLHGALRPFGTVGIIAAYDDKMKEPSLYMVEPSGNQFKYYGCAAGKGRQGAKTEIEKLDLSSVTCEEGVKICARIVHTLFEEGKDKPFELEMGWLSEGTGWEFQAVPADVVKAAEAKAKAEIEEAEMEDDEDDDE